jgi:molybdenum cofactor cytidylyltransferase
MLRLSDRSIAIVVLAAGRGLRMGVQPKLLLPLRDGRPVIWHAVSQAAALQPSELAVVVRPDLPEIGKAISDLPVRCIPNPRYEEGMGTSIAVGVAALGEGIQATLVMLGDEPEVNLAVVEKLVAAFLREGKQATIPLYGKEVGPPSLFSRELFPELMKLEGDTGGRQVVANRPGLVCLVPFAESDRPKDLDTPEDYQPVSQS